jgi:hypothetical protein
VTSSHGSEYASPAAFRAALTARLKKLATTSRWQLPQLQRQIGDWFRFAIGPGNSAGDGSDAIRFPVTAYVGPTVWQAFHIDLAGESLRVTGEPDEVPPLARLGMPGVEHLDYRVYPLVDHVADKIMATFQRYGQSRSPARWTKRRPWCARSRIRLSTVLRRAAGIP